MESERTCLRRRKAYWMAIKAFAAVKYGFDTAATFADPYNYEAEALGAKMLFPEDSFPVILEPLIKEPSDLKRLKIPDFTKAGRCPYVIASTKLSMEKLGDVAGTAAVATAPWSMAAQIRGFNNLIRDTRKNPEFAHKILDFCVDVIEAWITAQREAVGGAPAFPALADAFSCIPPKSSTGVRLRNPPHSKHHEETRTHDVVRRLPCTTNPKLGTTPRRRSGQN
jgi:hypothetical protein